MRRIIILTIAALVSLAIVSPAAASGPRYSRGDAQAMFATYPRSNRIFDRLEGASGLDIRPFQDFYGSTVYCAEDWHLLALAIFDFEFVVPAESFVWTRADSRAFLDGLTMEFSLDGEIVDTTSRPVRPYVDEPTRADYEEILEGVHGSDVVVGDGWGIQHGRIVAPGELSVGKHTLHVFVPGAFGPYDFDESVRFRVSDC